jgi:hypothetical protein
MGNDSKFQLQRTATKVMLSLSPITYFVYLDALEETGKKQLPFATIF